MEISRILYPTDFSDHAEKALPHALFLAEEFGAELHMFHAVVLHAADPANPELAFPDLESAYEEIHRWAVDRMEEAAPEERRPEVKVVKAQDRGIAPAPTIVEYAVGHDIDLVVMGTHGRRGVRRMLLGSVAEEVLRTVPCPVLTVRPGEGRETPHRPERILVPVDFSEHADLALEKGAELARRSGARLDILHVIPELSYPDPYFADAAAIRAMTRAAQEQVPEALQEKVSASVGDGGLEVQTHMEVGSPASTIVDVSEELESDMIVISSHGRTGLKRIFLGSVAEGVVRRATCPVFTVKAFGEEHRARGG